MQRAPGMLLLLATLIVTGPGCGGGGSAAQPTPPAAPIDVAYLKTVGGTLSAGGRSISTFSDGSCVVVGVFTGMATFGTGEANEMILTSAGLSDICIARYNADGTLAWAKRAGGLLTDSAAAVDTVSDGSCIVAGRFSDVADFGLGEANVTMLDDGNDGGDAFVARYNADGTLAWAKRGGGTGSEYASAIATYADASSVITGKFETMALFGPGEGNATTLTSVGSDDIFVARYNPDGTLAWAKRAGGMGQDLGGGVDTLADGSLLLSGSFTLSGTFGPGEANQAILVSAGIFDVCLARYNADGTLAWAKRAGGPSFDEAYCLSAFPDGGCVVGGFFRDAAVFGPGEANATTLTSVTSTNDAFVARFEPDGSLRWVRQSGGAAHGDNVRGVSAFADGSCVAAGEFQGLVLFNNGVTGETTVIGLGAADVFVAYYSEAGGLTWVRTAGGTANDRGYGVAAHADGSVAVCGGFETQAIFSPGLPDEITLIGVGVVDLFVARYNPDGGL